MPFSHQCENKGLISRLFSYSYAPAVCSIDIHVCVPYAFGLSPAEPFPRQAKWAEAIFGVSRS
jgi:hypothetical protein